MPIKLIAADMDDTLLTSKRTLTPRTLAALNQAMDRGALVVLASGRMVESMLDAANQVRPNAPMIAYNGGVTYDLKGQKIIHEQAVPPADAKALCALAEAEGVHIQGFSGGGYCFERDNTHSQAYADSIHLKGRAVGMKLSEYIEAGQYKLLMIDTAERIAQLKPLFQRRFEGRVNCVTSKPTYLECTAVGVDKGSALKALAEGMGVSSEEILAFGDGQNDLTMLDFAGLGYAMGNATESVRRQAAHVAPPSDEDGVAQVIERLLCEGRIGRVG